MQQITALLPHDGVAIVAKVWPEAVKDDSLRLFVPGGVPVCEVCFGTVASNSLPELLLHDDPTGILALLPKDNDLSTHHVQRNVVTLVVRQIMDLRCKQPDSNTCLLCLNKREFQESLHNQEWRCLLRKYAQILAFKLQTFYNDLWDKHHWTWGEELLWS